jgi:hypothetical protein
MTISAYICERAANLLNFKGYPDPNKLKTSGEIRSIKVY